MAGKSDLSGAERVAAFLLSLQRGAASTVLKHLGEDVLTEVIEAMQSLDPENASKELTKELYSKVALADRRREGLRTPRPDELKLLLETGLGAERAKKLNEEIRARRLVERPFLAIEAAPARAIAEVLQSESDAVAAVVLAHIEPALSAMVLAAFEVERALAIVRRMAVLEAPSAEMLHLIAGELEGRVLAEAGRPAPRSSDQKLQTIAELLNSSAKELEKGVLDGLMGDNAELAGEIREYMFTWEDLGNLDRRAMQKILGSVETRTLALALKACQPDVEQNLTGNLSSRVRDMVREERELAGAVPMSEVLAAREEIMKGVRSLMDSGEFQPTKGGNELVT